MKLNIYKGKEIIKTYEAETAFLSLGVCEDILKAVDIESLITGYNDPEKQLAIGASILKVVISNFDSFKELLKDTFEGLTDDELRNTDIGEVASTITEIVTYSVNKLFSITASKKK